MSLDTTSHAAGADQGLPLPIWVGRLCTHSWAWTLSYTVQAEGKGHQVPDTPAQAGKSNQNHPFCFFILQP